jgi:hypothetical protein
MKLSVVCRYIGEEAVLYPDIDRDTYNLKNVPFFEIYENNQITLFR